MVVNRNGLEMLFLLLIVSPLAIVSRTLGRGTRERGTYRSASNCWPASMVRQVNTNPTTIIINTRHMTHVRRMRGEKESSWQRATANSKNRQLTLLAQVSSTKTRSLVEAVRKIADQRPLPATTNTLT